MKYLLWFPILIIVGYLLLPSPMFPLPPPGSQVSTEPADTESIYRKAFYSDLSRSEIISYYEKQFYLFPQLRINHPPEEAYSAIRDQTQSSWLEQLVHPWRESLYINGFYPTKPTEQIFIGEKNFKNKITIHYFPSHPATRLTVLLLVSVSALWLFKEYKHV